MNGCFVLFNELLGYIGTASSEGIKGRMIVLSGTLVGTLTSQWSEVLWTETLPTTHRRRFVFFTETIVYHYKN